ncbi:MAG: hypothetical protein AB7G80_02830 [Dongiaceae bacterium]
MTTRIIPRSSAGGMTRQDRIYKPAFVELARLFRVNKGKIPSHVLQGFITQSHQILRLHTVAEKHNFAVAVDSWLKLESKIAAANASPKKKQSAAPTVSRVPVWDKGLYRISPHRVASRA